MKLEELLEGQETVEYEDEKKKRGNEWLREVSPNSEKTGAISLDCLKMKVRPEAHSCDGFIYYSGNDINKRSILFEMKNVNRSKLIEYISSRNSDSILEKVKDSVALLQKDIEFSGGLTGRELIEHTHLLLIYGGKADTISEASLGIGIKTKVDRDSKGHQRRASKMISKPSLKYTSTKSESEIVDRFGQELRRKGLTSCEKGYFGIPVTDPKVEKRNGKKILDFTILSKEDLGEVVENIRFFQDWEWGNYSTYFKGHK